MRRSRMACLLALASLAVAACGPSRHEETPAVAAPAPAITTADQRLLSGTYQAHGVTVQALSGLQREISGTLHLEVIEGARYEVDFELVTTAPDSQEKVPVRVRGSGRGFIVGNIFTGTTEQWMTLEPPAGGLDQVELRGVNLPAEAGRNIVSTSQATFDEEGTFHILLQSYPGQGEHYEPSATVLEARRGSAE